MSKNQPWVSAIAIFLNEENFLAEAIESVLAQTYSNWELLLVDDGSTDGSTAIAKNYAAQYPDKIRYLEHPNHENRGMSASRNLGLSKARGKYISPLDGDDVWMPQKLEQQVAILEAHPKAAMVFAPLLIWYSWTGKPEDRDRDHPYGIAKEGGLHPFHDTLVLPPKMLSLFLRYDYLVPGGVLARTDIIRAVGGGEDSFRGSFEDAIVHVKVCLKYPVYVKSEPWYKYRIHPDSCEREVIKAGKAEETKLIYLNWVEQYFIQQQIKNSEVWQALQFAFFPYRHPYLYYWQKNCLDFVRQNKILIKTIITKLLPPSTIEWLKTKSRSY